VPSSRAPTLNAVPHPFTIAADGDEFERRWWRQWTRGRFPSYEEFWLARVVTLTYDVKSMRSIMFQTTAELAAADFTDEDVAVAQLHYAAQAPRSCV
jgi:hypothetical protein